MANAPKFDVYQHVTDEIIAQIEAGTPPWRKPWTGGKSGAHLPLRFNGEGYRGINILMLWATAASQGYTSARWMTYKQAQELGGQVRKGEKSATVVKYGTIEKETENGDEKRIPYCRAYRVFNADQIEGLPDAYYIRPATSAPRAIPSLRHFSLKAARPSRRPQTPAPTMTPAATSFICRRSPPFTARRDIMAPSPTSFAIGQAQKSGWTA